MTLTVTAIRPSPASIWIIATTRAESVVPMVIATAAAVIVATLLKGPADLRTLLMRMLPSRPGAVH